MFAKIERWYVCNYTEMQHSAFTPTCHMYAITSRCNMNAIAPHNMDTIKLICNIFAFTLICSLYTIFWDTHAITWNKSMGFRCNILAIIKKAISRSCNHKMHFFCSNKLVRRLHVIKQIFLMQTSKCLNYEHRSLKCCPALSVIYILSLFNLASV